MEILKDKYPRIKLICAGKGPLEELINSNIKEMGLRKNIKLIGFRKDVNELLHASDAVCLLSKREGLGKCLLEGMITGKSLIATNTRGAKELISHDNNGYLVEIGDYKNTVIILKISIFIKIKERNLKEIHI